MERTNNPARRQFLRQIGTALASPAMFSLGSMGLASRVLAASDYSNLNDYKSLVCVYLEGGNDSHSAFAPYDNASYNEYAAIRQGLAIDRSELLPGTGNVVGFHPALPGLRTLFNEQRLAVAANIGNLFEPMTRDDLFDFYSSGTSNIAIPHELFSHEHQTSLIQLNRIATPGTNPSGWGGAMADLLGAANSNQNFPFVYSLAGQNAWQVGDTTQAFSLQAGQDIPRFETFGGDSWPPWEAARTLAWQDIVGENYTHPLQAQIATQTSETADRSALLRSALAAAPELTTPYDTENWLAVQLRSAAELIAIREQIGTRRQFFFVEIGGNRRLGHPRKPLSSAR